MGRGESQTLEDLDLASAWLTRSELLGLREALDSFVATPEHAQTLKRKRQDDESQPARSQQPNRLAEQSATATGQDIDQCIGGKAGWVGEAISRRVSGPVGTLPHLLTFATACLSPSRRSAVWPQSSA